MGGFSSEADVASSAKGGLDFGRVLTSSLHDEGGVLLQPDFEFDENGNIVELGGKNQNEVRTSPVSEVREDGPNDLVVDEQVNPWLASKLALLTTMQPLLADEDIEMAITNEPARPVRPAVFCDGDEAPHEPVEIESHGATAPQRQRGPKFLASDIQTALRNAELAAMNEDYMHNVALAARQKRQNRVSTQAKRNAAYWVFGLGIGSVGAGVGSSRVIHPLHFFSGEELYETLVSHKRPLEDEPEAEGRRVRARVDDEQGRMDIVDDTNLWNEVCSTVVTLHSTKPDFSRTLSLDATNHHHFTMTIPPKCPGT